MYRQPKTLALIACTILSVILIAYSIQSLDQVPSLGDFERPDIPFELPDIDLPINPEQTSLEIPDLDIGDMDPEPLLRILGETHTEYLRLQTYDDYYSGTWDTSLTQSVTYEGETLNLTVDLWTDYEQYNITITPLVDTMGYLPTPQNPIHLNLSNPAQFFEDQQIFQVPDVPGAYEIEYMLYEFSDAMMNATQVEEIPQYLEVPDYLDDDLKALAQTITNDTVTDYEAILALEDYLESYYDYNLSCPDPPPGVDPLEYFLFESGDGVCSHFNTALVMLARALGFSARLVGGYYIDPLAPLQEVYPIQSHAFTEIPFDDLGWIIFDATPSADIADMIGEIPDLNLSEAENPFDDLDFEFPEDDAPNERVFRIYGVTGSEYLRDGVGEYYNGSWYLTQGLPFAYDGHVIQDSVTGYDSVTEYSFIIEPSIGFEWFIPGPQNPVQINAYDPLTFFPDQKLFQTNTSLITPYQAIGNWYNFSQATLLNATPYVLEPYVQITAELEARLKPLAEQITMYESTPYEKVEALSEYLRDNYPYNASAADPPTGMDPVVWFIEYEQQGICTDYASALTMLTRSIGISARLVTGWLVNPGVEIQDVDAHQAHAYTEVLFDDLDWIIFDATPVGAPVVNQSSGYTLTFTNITYQDEVVSVGSQFIVAGTVVDEMANNVTGLDVLVYLKRDKSESGVLVGQGVVVDGLYNITCVFPANLPGGEYLVDVHTIGDDAYMDSWSDPPLVAYTETGFIFEAPSTVVAGKPYEVLATLVNPHTNTTIPHTQCQINTGTETLNRRTDENGQITITNSSPEGVVELTYSWDGAEYAYGSTATVSITSVAYQVALPVETSLTRGDRSIIRGRVHAAGIPGVNEPITLSLLGKESSTVTNVDGEFFITQSIPPQTPLGPTLMSITIPGVDEVENAYANVKAETRLTLNSPNSAQGDTSIKVSVKLLDDTGQPLGDQMVNITYRRNNETSGNLVQTNPIGEAETNLRLPRDKGQYTLRAYYAGQGDYLSASTSQVLNVIAPNQFPLLSLAALILMIGGVAGVIYLRDRRNVVQEAVATEVVDENGSHRLSLRLPVVDIELPPVWDASELLIEGRLVTTEDDAMPEQRLTFLVEENEVHSGLTDDDGVVSFFKSFELGVHELRLVNRAEMLQTSLTIKIVEYRDEVIRLFNNRFKEAKEQFERINDNYTARELYNALREHVPEETHEPLWDLVYLFEEANYSLHMINRDHYTRFYKAMRRYREALDAEIS